MRLPRNAACWLLGFGLTVVLGAAADGPARNLDSGSKLSVRTEYFAALAPGATEESLPVNLVAWKCRREGQLEVLEREVLFGAGELRLLHTENMGLGTPRLVWRELGRMGRTWVAEWSPERGELLTLEFSAAEDVHRLQGVEEVSFPLGLVEELRHGIVRGGPVGRLSPTHAGLEQVSVSALEGLPADLPAWTRTKLEALEARCVELRTEAGRLLVRYVFDGDQLMAFQWGSGGAWSVRVSQADWQRYEEAWYVAQRRAASSPQSATPAK
ncbi:MAG: hypothetical protein ACI8QC_003307 [Planctomycetota bacterium]|jgi:hypothetical protein